jgi:hypothetical protein
MKIPLALFITLVTTACLTATAAHAHKPLQSCANLTGSTWQGVVILMNNQSAPVSFTVTSVEARPYGYIVQSTLRYNLNHTPAESPLVGFCLDDAQQTIKVLSLHNDDNNDKFETGQYAWDGNHSVLLNIDGRIGGQNFYNGQVFN